MKINAWLYIASLDSLPHFRERWGESLSEERRKRIDSTKNECSKRMGMLCEYLLFEALSELDKDFIPPCRYERNEWGKPFLLDYDYNFNTSHDEAWAALVISRAEVGIDIELLHDVPDKLLKRIATNKELLSTDGADTEAFFKLWTRKESVQKMHGLGFSLPMSRIETSRYHFYEMRIDDLFVCVASMVELNVICKRMEGNV